MFVCILDIFMASPVRSSKYCLEMPCFLCVEQQGYFKKHKSNLTCGRDRNRMTLL